MDFRTKAACLLLLALLVGCSGTDSQPVTSQQDSSTVATSHSWTIELSVSGGITGMQRQLTIEDSGNWRASDRSQGHKSGTLPTEQLTQLENGLLALEADSPQSKPAFPGRCADCVESKITATVDGKRYSASRQSGDKPVQPYADLFTQLSQLLHETFSTK